MTKSKLASLVANTLVKTDAFVAAHGYEWAHEQLMGDDVTEEALREKISEQLPVVKKHNPTWDGNLET